MRNKIVFALLIGVFVFGCSAVEPKTIARKYDLAIQYSDKGEYSSATPLFEEIIKENPGTRYAVYSYLKLGDIHLLSDSNKLNEAEANYRTFLEHSPQSHLVPYVLGRLIELNYKRSSGSLLGPLLGEKYIYYRDSSHFKNIIAEYQRFYLIYPESLYLEEAEQYLEKSIEALAEHELLIGDWYFDNSLYAPAIYRYIYILDNYPNFKKQEETLQKLIVAYRKNYQPELAEELERIRELRIKKKTDNK